MTAKTRQARKATPAKAAPAKATAAEPERVNETAKPVMRNEPAPGLRQTVTSLGPATKVKRCTVKVDGRQCGYNTTPGDEICSYHAATYTREGHKRATGPIQQPGAVDTDTGPGVVREATNG